MHPSHVKSKENPMYPITPQDFHNDPALRRRLFEMAHRERAAAIRAGFAWLRERLTPRLHPGDWIGRLG
jgi:hypothetical protein